MAGMKGGMNRAERAVGREHRCGWKPQKQATGIAKTEKGF